MSTRAQGYIIRCVDKTNGGFLFAVNLRPGFAPTVTRDVRHAKRYARKASAERVLASFRAARRVADDFEVVFDILPGGA